MKTVLDLIRKHPAYRGLVSSVAAGPAALSGLRGSAVSMLAACLSKDEARPVILITSSGEKAEWVLDDLETFEVDPLMEFPVEDIFTDGSIELPDAESQARMTVLCRLAEEGGSNPVAVIPVQAALQPVQTPGTVRSSSMEVSVGNRVGRDDMVRRLVNSGFDNCPMVEVPGEISVRGSILDVYPFSSRNAIRIEFSGNAVDSMRIFDVSSQESIERLDTAVINIAKPGRGGMSCVVDHFPDNTIVMLEEPVELQQSAGSFTRTAGDMDILTFSRMMRSCRKKTVIELTPLPDKKTENVIEMTCRTAPQGSAGLEEIEEYLAGAADKYEFCFLMCDTPAESERIKEVLPGSSLPENIQISVGRLQQGFVVPDINACVLTSHELFNRYRRPRRTMEQREGSAVEEISGILPGDYVVHTVHGIGRFEGLMVLENGDGHSEFMVLKYADEAKVYIPVSQMLMVQKYVGGGRRRPRLSRIRGKEWERRKEAALAAAKDLAVRLLQTQAARMAEKRKSYPPDDIWQNEFETAFRFTETDDQLRVLSDIKSDLSGSVPMDRLICGDVGYGKTEIAMRAAFKVANSGRQVALLAPTTILVQQHARTFRERMAAYPVRIEELSRFRTESEQRHVIESLAEGKTDIVIGTHRLIQNDVAFSNLGLVILDEEQRFGVEQKEYLKKFRETVDILTLTATPIPRTLHMSLLGLRDISALKTPPVDRSAIETRVMDFNEERIRAGILRELNRSGQVYFIHNRVHNIRPLAQRIESIVPEARIGVGHGQMSPRELEDTMTSFLDGEIDVLVSTTIVESGLDIPSANTIFVNRADDYGLADLHQLRGRVGRYKHHAYAYFILPERRPVTPRAARRLKAIEDFAYLGAGFDIAMRDLEIRGAGNILGREQHGHIAAVGYGMYCRLLERSVAELRGDEVHSPEWVDMRIGLSSYIPEDYISDTAQRMEIYRRFSSANGDDAVTAVIKALKDRFGPVPDTVASLAEESKIRVKLSLMGVSTVQRAGDFLEILLREERSEMIQVLTDSGFARVGPDKMMMEVSDRSPEDILRVLQSI